MPRTRQTTINKPDLFQQIYLYLFLSLGLITLSIGIFLLSQNLVKRAFLPKYPLQSFEETRCDSFALAPFDARLQTIDKKSPDFKKQKNLCLTRIKQERKVKKTIELTNALTLIGLGGLIFLSHLWFVSKLKK